MPAFLRRTHRLMRGKLSPMRRRACALALSLAVTLWAASPLAAVTIELPYVGAPLPPMVMTGLATSAGIATSTWGSAFSDPITLKFKMVAISIPGGPLGYFDVDPTTSPFAYSSVAAALALDKTSAADYSAVSSLQPGPALSMITNDTAAGPDDPSLRMHVTAPLVYNSTLRLTRANQKALGLLPGLDGGTGSDGTIVINSIYFPIMDFDPSDGIDSDKIDMTAVLRHELAHGMGFISGVDHIDYASSDGAGHNGPDVGVDYSTDTIFTVLDLFRYSAYSTGLPDQPISGAVLDWAAGVSDVAGDNPYLSYDGGVTSSALFSTGIYFGDGYQAQHWKDSSYTYPGPPFGIMDPNIDDGELGMVTPLDFLALDLIGYTLVPEPSSITLAAMALLATVFAAASRNRAHSGINGNPA